MKSVLLPALLISALTTSAQLITTDFELQPPGTAYDDAQWTADGLNPSWSSGFDVRSSVDDQISYSGNQSLRIFYPAGQHGTANTGGQAPIQLPAKQEYYMSYWLRFDENFSWGGTSQGGKLPGLAGGDNCSGCKICDGSNGFTARFMWRAAGKAVLYLYHMDKVEACGDDHELHHQNGDVVHFAKGEWIHVMERVKANTGNNYDGEVQAWINGEEVLSMAGLRFVNNGDLVDNLYISTFHGGSGTQWNAQNDSYTWLDDIKVSTHKSDVDFSSCSGINLGADLSLCGSSSVQIDAGNATNKTFSWYQNGDLMEGFTTSSISVSQAGTYKTKVDSSGCIREGEITVSSELLPDLGPDRAICQTSFMTIDAGLAAGNFQYAWAKDNELISNESEISTSTAGIYAVTVSASGCTDASDQVTITSDLLVTTGDTACPGEPFLLSVDGSGTYEWFDPNDNYLGTGNSIDGTFSETGYYSVIDADGLATHVGMEKPTTSDSKTWTEDRFERKMTFTISTTLTIDTVWIQPAATLDATIRVLNLAEEELFSKTFNGLDASFQPLALGFELAPGQYLMDAVGTTGKLHHSNENDTSIDLPYVIADVISIDGSNETWIDAKPYYLFFYNWKVSSGNACAATPVLLIESESCLFTSTGNDKAAVETTLPTPFTDSFSIQLPTTTKISVYNIKGQLVQTGNYSGNISLGSTWLSGMHFIEIGDVTYKAIKQ